MIDLSSWYVQLGAAVIILFLSIYWNFVKDFDYWKKKGIYFLQPTPFFGNIKDLILLRKSESEVYKELYEQLGSHAYGGIYQANKPTLVIKDPELIKSVLVKDFGNFHDRGIPIDEKNNPLSAHLFLLSGRKWRNLRVKLTPTFTSGKMKAMFDILTRCSGEMLVSLEKIAARKDTIEVKEMFAQMTTDVIGSYAFGLQLNSIKDPNSEFRSFGRKIFQPSTALRLRFMALRFMPWLRKLGIMKKVFDAELEKFFIGAVSDTVKYREQNNIKRNDFLQLLIELKNKGKLEGDAGYSKEDAYLQNSIYKEEPHDDSEENDTVLTDSLLAAQCFVFFAAGFETSSTTASYCLYELSVNPDIQERLRAEVDSILKEYNGKITYEAIQKMKYLDKVVDETLRKYPPVAKLDRQCTKPFTIPETDITLEKGVQLAIPAYALHHDPKYFPNPEKFDPERFSEEQKASRPQFAYLPFGEGPRICIGMRFGLLQTKVGLAALISKYKFSVSQKTTVPINFDPKGLVLTAKGGIWLQISERS